MKKTIRKSKKSAVKVLESDKKPLSKSLSKAIALSKGINKISETPTTVQELEAYFLGKNGLDMNISDIKKIRQEDRIAWLEKFNASREEINNHRKSLDKVPVAKAINKVNLGGQVVAEDMEQIIRRILKEEFGKKEIKEINKTDTALIVESVPMNEEDIKVNNILCGIKRVLNDRREISPQSRLSLITKEMYNGSRKKTELMAEIDLGIQKETKDEIQREKVRQFAIKNNLNLVLADFYPNEESSIHSLDASCMAELNKTLDASYMAELNKKAKTKKAVKVKKKSKK